MKDTHFDYTWREWTIAAQTLGEQVARLMFILHELPDGPAAHLAYRTLANDEMQRICVNLTIDAAHAANCAIEEAEKEARYLSRETREVNDALGGFSTERNH